MFLLTWLRWLRGTVTFLITGAFPERLVNLCIRSRLPVWGVSRRKDGLIAHTYARQYRRLRPMARASRTKTRVQERRGLPFWQYRYRSRWGLMAGGAGAVLLLMFLSTRIWIIDVRGCDKIEPRDITSQLSALGLRPGVAAREIDSRLMQRQMLLLDDRLAWIAINLVGSTAQIEIRERVKIPERLDPKDRAGNVVAACDGQIKYLEIYEGQPLVRVGDTVTKGEVIVSGIMEDQYGNTQLRYARAKVIAQVQEEQTVEVPMEQAQWVASGDPQQRSYLSIFGREIPLFFPVFGGGEEAFSISREERSLMGIPGLSLVGETHTPMRLETVRLTELQAKETAMHQMKLLTEGDEVLSIVRRAASGDPQENCYRLTEHRIVEKDIAVEVEIFLN